MLSNYKHTLHSLKSNNNNKTKQNEKPGKNDDSRSLHTD